MFDDTTATTLDEYDTDDALITAGYAAAYALAWS